MPKSDQPKIHVCTDESVTIPRQPDGDAFILHCTGGFRAGEINKDAWKIEPILEAGKPCIKGFFSKAQLQAFVAQNGFSGIAFQRIGWTNGAYHSSWTPINPSRKNHFLGPADLWRNISSNLSRSRTDYALRNMSEPAHDKIAALLDDRTEPERLAQSISLSLRSADISIEQIAEYYHEQLVDSMASGSLGGQRRASTLDQTLFAHVHSFFMHLGAARDYLAAFIATGLGKDPVKVDSLGRLVKILRSPHFAASPILQLMRSRGFLAPSAAGAHKWEVSGWLQIVTSLRNEFVHTRPYGSKSLERMGYAVAVNIEQGIYRYTRPIVINGDADNDLLAVVTSHYRHATAFFQDAANVSGQDTSILSLTDKDIISLKMTKK